MAYNLEKYRDKREKVLGVKKRGLSFGVLALAVSCLILSGLGAVVIPKSIGYLNNRNLEDAIYKFPDITKISHHLIMTITSEAGIENLVVEAARDRVVVTFNARETDIARIAAIFKKNGLEPILLNQVSHSQRMSSMQKKARFETPVVMDTPGR